jgi:hypothetical protein
MTHSVNRFCLLAAVLLAPLSACDGPAAPVVPGDELLFIRQSPTSPPLVSDEISFWAKRGQGIEVRMPYTNGHECLRFKLPGDALAAYPDGTAFRDGDSVRITIRLAQSGFYNFEFQPAGLRFSREHPAELRVSYSYRDPDVDGDGDVDARDELEFDAAAFWKQERAGEPWRRIGTARIDSTDEMRAELIGFTRYALASN